MNIRTKIIVWFAAIGGLIALVMVLHHYKGTFPHIAWRSPALLVSGAILLIGGILYLMRNRIQWRGPVQPPIRFATILMGSLGIGYMIANAIVYHPYFETWKGLIYFLVVRELAIGMAVLGAIVAQGLFGPPRPIPYRKIIGVFVILTIAFNVLSWAMMKSGLNLGSWATYPREHLSEIGVLALALFCAALLLWVVLSGTARKNVGRALALGLVVLVVLGALRAFGLPESAVSTYYNYKYFHIRPGPEAKEDCYKVTHTITSDDFEEIDVDGDNVPGKYRQHRDLEKSHGVTIGIWQSWKKPSGKAAPTTLLRKEECGRIRLDSKRGFQSTKAPLWAMVLEDNTSSEVNAVYLPYKTESDIY